MTDEDALFRAILDSPDDDTLRLVYADWLEEHGQLERAEFIRVQIELSRLPESDWWELQEREEQLLAEHKGKWLTSLKVLGREVTFRRGFVEQVHTTTNNFLRHAERFFRLAPIREVRLEKAKGRVAEIAAFPLLARLSGLSLEGNELEVEDAYALAASPHVANLISLDLTANNSPDECTHGITDDGLVALAASEHLIWLQVLRLGSNVIYDDRGVIALANSSHLRNLKELALCDPWNELTPRAAAAMARSSALAGLETLNLDRCIYDDEVLCVLAEAEFMKTLRILNLHENGISGRGAVALLQSAYVGRTKSLDLSDNADLRDVGLEALAACSALDRVDSLGLAQCGFTDDGLLALLKSPYLPRLGSLDLTGGLSVGFAAGLDPDDSGPSLTDVGARALAECPQLADVYRLVLYDNPGITEAGRELLRARFGDRVWWD